MNYAAKSVANILKDTACQLFLNRLDKIDGAKDLVLSDSILVQLDSICGMRKLRQNAVDKVFKFEAKFVPSETRNRVFVIRPTIEEVRLVAQQINLYLNQDDDKSLLGPTDMKFWIIFVPKFVHYCDLALEEEGIYEYVTILECPLGLIPLEYDVYSLEDDTIFKTLFLNKDITPISSIVNSILQLQALTGNIFDVHGQGNIAKMVADKLDQANLIHGVKPGGLFQNSSSNHIEDFENLKFNECKPRSRDEEKSTFTDLYLIDRDCDFASLLLSQLNYEGFLDESYNICCNKLEFSTTTKSPSKSNDNIDENITIVKHSLNSDIDPIFRYIRDNHFSTVISLLRTKNQEMKDRYSRSQGMNLSNLSSFVANELKGLQAEFKCLALHISACEEIMKERNKFEFGDQLKTEKNILDGDEMRKSLDYVTKMIAHQLNKHVPLRLLSLLSLTQGGLPPKDYERFHSLYCENYGLQNNVTFSNLKKLGIITEMNLSLAALTGGKINNFSPYSSTPREQSYYKSMPSTLSLASFTGALSSFTEKASGHVAAAVSSSVLPRRGNLSAMMKKFQLVPEVGDAGYNIREPKDPAFVFNGFYIPLICQLINHCVLTPPPTAKKNTQPNMSPNELMKLLPGPNFKRRQAFLGDATTTTAITSTTIATTTTTTTTNAASTTSMNAANPQIAASQLTIGVGSSCSSSQPVEKSILVYFIGGATFAEITALRFIAKQRNVKIAIATTSVMNGNKLIESLFPKT